MVIQHLFNVICGSAGPDHSKVFEVNVIINNEVFAREKDIASRLLKKQAARCALEKYHR